MSQFSTTRQADRDAAITANAALGTVVNAIRVSSAGSRLNNLEAFELIQALKVAGYSISATANVTSPIL